MPPLDDKSADSRDRMAKALGSKSIFAGRKTAAGEPVETGGGAAGAAPVETGPELLIPELDGLDAVAEKLSILDRGTGALPSSKVIPPTAKEKQLYEAQQAIIQEFAAKNKSGAGVIDQKLLSGVNDFQELEQILVAVRDALLPKLGFALTIAEQRQLVRSAMNEIVGSGPLEPLMQDPAISEVMVNGPRKVFVERHGLIEMTDVRFYDDNHLLNVIARIISRVGRRIDYSSPYADARLPDGSRVHAIIPPLALDGPVLTIRKFKKDSLQIEDMISFGALTTDMAYFLGAGVKARLNIIVAGGTGTGKTTLLNILSTLIPESQRIVTIEDSAELKLAEIHPHVVRLESRAAGTEGSGSVPIRELVRQALRMRPDRIVVGECRGGEAMDMLQAMNTGHDGSMTTGHANSAEELLERLNTMCLMAGLELPSAAIKRQIASAIDMVVHLKRYPDGSRKISEICEITGFVDGEITFRPLFWYEATGRDKNGKMTGSFRTATAPPHFIYKFDAEGINFPREIFEEKK